MDRDEMNEAAWSIVDQASGKGRRVRKKKLPGGSGSLETSIGAWLRRRKDNLSAAGCGGAVQAHRSAHRRGHWHREETTKGPLRSG
jgi:hypothetical protein